MTPSAHFAASAVALLLLAAPACAADAPITIAHPWLRATPRTAPVAGGYATITNGGSEPDTLLSASLAVAPEGQIHSMTMKNGVMEMRRLDEGLTVAPGATVTLRPGGDHLMFLNPKAQLKEGENVKGTLVFKRAGAVPVTFAVGGMAAKNAPGTKSAPGTKAAGRHGGAGSMDMDMPGMH